MVALVASLCLTGPTRTALFRGAQHEAVRTLEPLQGGLAACYRGAHACPLFPLDWPLFR